jgi:hypothetical protein
VEDGGLADGSIGNSGRCDLDDSVGRDLATPAARDPAEIGNTDLNARGL